MVISHNLTAMNAQRQLNISGVNQKKSAEILSSGYKINRAADNAAGLSISEKMRSQIRGLNQASRNIQDGISLIQVADGALNEDHEILQRMNVLAVQAANDTNCVEDRQAIQEEINQLVLELDRVANTTSFNDNIYPLNKGPVDPQINMLKAINKLSGNGTSKKTDPNTYTIDYFRSPEGDFGAYEVTWDRITLKASGVYTFEGIDDPSVRNKSRCIDIQEDCTIIINCDTFRTKRDDEAFCIAPGKKVTIEPDSRNSQGYFRIESDNACIKLGDGSELTVKDIGIQCYSHKWKCVCLEGNATLNIDHAGLADVIGLLLIQRKIPDNSLTFNVYNDGYLDIHPELNSSELNPDSDIINIWSGNATYPANYDTSVNIMGGGQIVDHFAGNSYLAGHVKVINNSTDQGPYSSENSSSGNNKNHYSISTEPDIIMIQAGANPWQAIPIHSVNATAGALGVTNVSVMSFNEAGEAISTFQFAINKVSEYRSYFGAMQNRLEQAMAVDDNVAENTQAAESRIRDTDMAAEMVRFSKESILAQFGQSMLAQTNQSRQRILTLLQ